ncbi:MAG: 2Fe-2S iron-sulfur cluster-binding protein, partial [Gammaproteobacteria bacterium]|nr:2Fe-2S iron-sulfur cluster-binding protein [Gammaproteobacteria bacterium]MCZ6796383.1 2Fe-2S iron-sulfur cluster-binding protein [Gammaproteobacteria bacterium]
MSDDEVNVLFMPSGLRGQVPVGTTVLQAAQRLGVDLESICGGQGKCRKCQVLPQEGEFPKHGITSRLEHLSEF